MHAATLPPSSTRALVKMASRTSTTIAMGSAAAADGPTINGLNKFLCSSGSRLEEEEQNSYVCEAMEGVTISSGVLETKNSMKSNSALNARSPHRSRPKPIPPPLVLRDDVTNNLLLAEFAIIATSPRSPLMQKNLPIRKRAYSCSSMETIHTYARNPLTPPPGILSPPSSQVSCSSLSSSTEEIEHRISPSMFDNGGGFEGGSLIYRWPIAVWQCFLKGSRVLILDGNSAINSSSSSWCLAEELGSKMDNFRALSQYAPNGLRLINECYTTNDVFPTAICLRFAPVEPLPDPQPEVQVEFPSDHPFFVKDKGWSSVEPELTIRTYGIPCQTLQVNDICLPPTHPDATLTSDMYRSIKGYDFTAEDTSAVFALSTMAKKLIQCPVTPSSTIISPPISPIKKCNPLTISGVVEQSKPKRPMNGFMLFAKKYRISYTQQFPGKDNRAISVLLGDIWKRMSVEERGMYSQEAKILADEQKKLHPDCWKRRRSLSTSS